MTVTPLLIAGPTASGKSAYAMRRARAVPSLIVNADSMQVYRDLSVITARPPVADEAAVPHALYGCVPGHIAYSTGQYLRDVASVLADAREQNLRPIIVGGTGLYFKALLEGLSPVPEIAAEVRAFWRAEADRMGPAQLHAVLAMRDPVMAERLRPSDPQRVTRALEVLEGTGRSLAAWQQIAGTPLIEADACERVVFRPDRAMLSLRADQRFDAMIAQGALGEIERLMSLELDPALPVMRALGVPQLIRYVLGEMSLEDAVAEGKQETRRYIKRQLTWIKKGMAGWECAC
jgi:tRNA dimethylallyltransferase